MKQSKNIERKGKTREKEHICLIFICMHVYNKKKKLPSLHDIPTFFLYLNYVTATELCLYI